MDIAFSTFQNAKNGHVSVRGGGVVLIYAPTFSQNSLKGFVLILLVSCLCFKNWNFAI